MLGPTLSPRAYWLLADAQARAQARPFNLPVCWPCGYGYGPGYAGQARVGLAFGGQARGTRVGLIPPNPNGYDLTFSTSLFQGDHDVERTMRAIGYMMDALVSMNVDYLREHPETPWLYQSGVRYQEEKEGEELWQDIPKVLERGVADCLPLSTLVLRDDYTFATLGEISPGDRIMADGVWTEVLDAVVSGEKPILAFGLENGSVLRCSPEHRLLLEDGSEVRAKDVVVGQHLLSPTRRFPTSAEPQTHPTIADPVDLAWILGVYIADGWHDKLLYRFSISGDDETPKRGKREQKDRVEAIMRAARLNTRRHKKYVAVNDRSLTEWISRAGHVAPVKRVPDMCLTDSQVIALLEGLQTDCSVANSGTLTHGTVSPVLALQLRVLYRMIGQSVHLRRWDEHGGLGANPIYRAVVRRPVNEETNNAAARTRALRLARCTKVRSIVQEDEMDLCGDITTSSGKFYLPESDLIVHNCEDLAGWRVGEMIVRENMAARPHVSAARQPDGKYLFHIRAQRPDGTLEDPSQILGMP